MGNALNALQDKVRALEANLAGPSSSDSSSEGGSEDEEGGGMRRPGRLGARGGAARGQARGPARAQDGAGVKGRRAVATRLDEALESVPMAPVSGIGQARVELNLVESKLVVAEKKLAEAEKRVAEAEKREAALRERHRGALERERARATKREADLKAEIEALRAELERVRSAAQVAGAEGGEMERYAAEIEELRDAVQTEKTSVEQRLEGLRAKHASELAKVKAMHAEALERVRGEEVARVRAEGEAKLAEAKRDFERLVATQDGARTEAGAADGEMARRVKAEQEVARMRVTLREARESLAAHQRELASRGDPDALAEERRRHAAALSQVTSQHGELKRRFAKVKQERDSLQAQAAATAEDWRRTFEKNTSEMSKLRETMAAMERRTSVAAGRGRSPASPAPPQPAVAALQAELSEREANVQTLVKRNDRLVNELAVAHEDLSRLEAELSGTKARRDELEALLASATAETKRSAPAEVIDEVIRHRNGDGGPGALHTPTSPSQGQLHGLLERAEQMEKEVGRLLVSEEGMRDEEQRAAKARLFIALKSDPGNLGFIQSLYDDIMTATSRTCNSRSEWHRQNLFAGSPDHGWGRSPGPITTVIDPDLLAMGETMNERLGAIQQEMSRLATTLGERAAREEEDRQVRVAAAAEAAAAAAAAPVHRPRRSPRPGGAREKHSYWRDVGARPR